MAVLIAGGAIGGGLAVALVAIVHPGDVLAMLMGAGGAFAGEMLAVRLWA